MDTTDDGKIVAVKTEYMNVELGNDGEKDIVILYVRYVEIDSIEPLALEIKDFKKLIKEGRKLFG
jgi:hypothetical protein